MSASSAAESSATTSTKAKSSASSASSAASAAAESADAKGKPKEKKLVVVNIDYTVQKAALPGSPRRTSPVLKDRIKALEGSDIARRQREEALEPAREFHLYGSRSP